MGSKHSDHTQNVNGDGETRHRNKTQQSSLLPPQIKCLVYLHEYWSWLQLETVLSPLETAARVRAPGVASHGVAEYIYYADTVWSVLGLAWPAPADEATTRDRRGRPGNIGTIQCSLLTA